jgi:hypothetical protein
MISGKHTQTARQIMIKTTKGATPRMMSMVEIPNLGSAAPLRKNMANAMGGVIKDI